MLDEGQGAWAFVLDASGQTPRLPVVVIEGASFDVAAVTAVVTEAPPGIIERPYLSPRVVCGLATEVSGMGTALVQHPSWQRVSRTPGMVDAFGVKVVSPNAE